MREVAIIGVGMAPFGVFPNKGIKEQGEEACWKAIKDAQIDPKQIQVGYCGNATGGFLDKQGGAIGQLVLAQVGITGIPITRIESVCASGSGAVREAYMAIAGGFYDIAIAVGVEKMSGVPTDKAVKALVAGSDVELEGDFGLTFPAVFGMIANRHMHQYGTTLEQMALVSVKSHRNGALNPYAHFQREITLEQVINGIPIAAPLTLHNCCPISDGAAALILADRETALRMSEKPVWIAAAAFASGSYHDDQDITTFGLTKRCAEEAYTKAGCGPEDIDLAEVHDCFSIAEIIHYEDLGFCKKGEGGLLIEKGETAIGGRIPVGASGGLKAKGHPVGATGVGQIVELTEQLRGEAGKLQVEGAKVGLAHCMGGFTHGDGASVAVHILKN